MRAVNQFGTNPTEFGTVIYQASLDGSLWRLVMAAHQYKLNNPSDPIAALDFSRAYWANQLTFGKEHPSDEARRQISGWFEEAARDAKNSASSLPENTEAHLAYGTYLQYFVMGMGKVPAMLKEFKKAEELSPQRGDVHAAMAEAYFGDGSYTNSNADKVIREAHMALNLDHRQTEMYFLIASAYWQKNDFKNDELYIRKYLNANPSAATRPDIVRAEAILKTKLHE
jgi:tetratricopeptide (TPR) repeat protein